MFKKLANQAILQMSTLGRVEVVCPKCQQKPKVLITRKDKQIQRACAKCGCGYIATAEIYF